VSKTVVRSIGVSLDGFSAGPNQDLQHPLGVGAEAIFAWFFATRVFREMRGEKGGSASGVDYDFARQGFQNVGAWILGRNMFGPVRGPWPDDSWKGWWGENPPFHVPCFVLTHHTRAPLVMKGGTTFYFVTDGIRGALARAREAANGKDVRVGGGVATIREYLQARLLDELYLAVSPVLLGAGENLFAGVDLPKLGYQHARHVTSESVTHVILTKQG
jgi:dihydrofolate reductase